MPIRDLKDLVESQEYSAMTIKNSAFEGLFMNAQDGIFKDLWKKIKKLGPKGLQPDTQGGVEAIYQGKNVFVVDGNSVIATTNNNCSITLVKTRLIRQDQSMITRKQNDLLKIITYRRRRTFRAIRQEIHDYEPVTLCRTRPHSDFGVTASSGFIFPTGVRNDIIISHFTNREFIEKS